MSASEIRVLEQLPPDAAALYRSALSTEGSERLELLRRVQDEIDTGKPGMLGVYGAIQAQIVELLDEVTS